MELKRQDMRSKVFVLHLTGLIVFYDVFIFGLTGIANQGLDTWWSLVCFFGLVGVGFELVLFFKLSVRIMKWLLFYEN